MNKFSGVLLSIGGFLFPMMAFAQTSAQANAAAQAASFVAKVNQVILFPLIALLTAVAFLVFLWGCAQYFINATNDQARQQGVKHITFGIIGLVVMLSAYAILSIAAATFGLDKQLECANDPNAGGCRDVFVIPNTVPGGSPADGETTTPNPPANGVSPLPGRPADGGR